MKTDKQKLLDLFDEFGIGYCDALYGDKLYTVTIEAHVGDKVVGYTGFAADFKFNLDESFVEVGVWE